jgi:prophage regulatory protein
MRTFIRLKEVMRITGLGRSTIYQGVLKNWFPAPIKLGRKASGWDLDEINEWQDACIALRDRDATAAARRSEALEEKHRAMARLGGELNL